MNLRLDTKIVYFSKTLIFIHPFPRRRKTRSNKMLTKFYLSLQNSLNSPMEKELFETTQQYFQKLGINLKQTTQTYPFIVRNVRTFYVFGSGVVASFFYTFFLAKSFEEYIASFYVLSSMLICFSTYAFVVWRMDKLIQFVADVSQYIEERKSDFQINFNLLLLQ